MQAPDFIASLNEPTHEQLANAICAGMLDARLAAQCLRGLRGQHATTTQLLAYLARSIDHLERARGIIRERLEA